MHRHREEIRVFFSIPIPKNLSEYFFEHALGISMGNPRKITPKNNMHITAFFLGNIELNSLEKLKLMVAEELQNIVSFTLQFQAFRFAPPNNPYMLWATFHHSESFLRLHQSLARASQTTPQQKKLIPHITLARFKRLPKEMVNVTLIEPFEYTLKIIEVGLYQSILKPEGVKYVKLERFILQTD